MALAEDAVTPDLLDGLVGCPVLVEDVPAFLFIASRFNLLATAPVEKTACDTHKIGPGLCQFEIGPERVCRESHEQFSPAVGKAERNGIVFKAGLAAP